MAAAHSGARQGRRAFLETRDSLKASEDRLFREWRGSGPRLVVDGAMECYATERKRLLFVLKEPNDPSQEWEGDLRKAPTWYGESGYRSATWATIASWAAMLLDSDRLPRPISRLDWEKHLSRVAVVNLKKTGGDGRADHAAISAYLDDAPNASMLRQQLELYAPDVTVCGGDFVADCLNKLYGWDRTQWRAIERGGQGDHISELDCPELGRVISFWHPAQWGRNADDLLDILGEVRGDIPQLIEPALCPTRTSDVTSS